MARRQDYRSEAPEKDRVREEIALQVQAFLNRGGKIEVVGELRRDSTAMGSVWRGHEDPAALLG